MDKKKLKNATWSRQKVRIKALLGILARLPRDMHMLGSMDGKHGGVYVEYVSLMVSCYWIIAFIMHDNQIDNMVNVT